MVQLYRTLGTRGLVRIGGIIGDHTRFVPEGTPLPRSQQDTTIINKAVLADLGGFLKATGWKAMWTLNLGTGTKEEAAAEAQAVSAALGDRLQSFEIGNEVDQLKRFDGYASYHAAYLDYKVAIRAALPGAVFSGPDSAGNTDWSVAFAETESADMKLLIHHYYRGGAKTPQATIETLLSPHREWETKLQKLHDACAEKGITFRINEVNSFYGGSKADVSDTFALAPWRLDYMFRVAAHGGVGVNMETDMNQLGFVSHYSPIFRDGNDELTSRPEYYGMLAFAMAGKGSLVKLTTSETPLDALARRWPRRYAFKWSPTRIGRDTQIAVAINVWRAAHGLAAIPPRASRARVRGPRTECRFIAQMDRRPAARRRVDGGRQTAHRGRARRDARPAAPQTAEGLCGLRFHRGASRRPARFFRRDKMGRAPRHQFRRFLRRRRLELSHRHLTRR